MRLLRNLAEEDKAQALLDGLADQGIAAQVTQSRDGDYGVWVIDEEHLTKAEGLAARWLDGDDPDALNKAAHRGRAARELETRIEERRQRQVEAVTRQMIALQRPRPTPLTWGLLALCAAVAALTKLGEDRAVVEALTIVDPRTEVLARVVQAAGASWTWLALPWDEPWRLVTPIVLHFGFIHILFNLLWLRELGRVVEINHGTAYLAALIVVCGVVSNIAQYEIGQSPMFGGLSGVVYALLGFIWLRGRMDPHATYRLSTGTVQLMLIWLALGFVGGMQIANWCHLFGLISGLVWAYLAVQLSAAKRR